MKRIASPLVIDGVPAGLRALIAIAALALVSGCAHGSRGHVGGVERLSGELQYRGPVYSARAWESAMRLELEGTAIAREAGAADEDSQAPSPTMDPAAEARRAVAASWHDPHVLAIALTHHPSDPALRAAARAATGARATDCELVIARTALLPDPESALVQLAARCERALVPAIRMALERADHRSAVAAASRGVASRDPSVEQAVLDAFVIAADLVALEAFVARHRDEPPFVARVAARARATTDVPRRAAMLAPLATLPSLSVDAVSALLDAARGNEARDVLARLAPTSIDARVALATLALRAGDAERAIAWASSAYANGASTRALAVQASALESLGRHDEATRLRATLGPETAGVLQTP